MYFRYIFIIFWLCAGWGHAQEADFRLTEEERTETLRKIQRLLDDNYVFAETARKCITFIEKQIEDGAYDGLTHPRAFVRQINTDLSKIHHDPHLRLSFALPEAQRFEDSQPDLALLTRSLDRRRENYGIKEVRILSDNIGYLNLTAFEPLEMSRKQLNAALKLLENTAAMVIDLRRNGGGNLNTVQFLSSHFISPSKLLFSYYWRRGDYIENFPVINNLPGRRRPGVPLFILIGPATFSAAEEFAYNMQAQKRAVVIGEQSGGGANPGFSFDLSSRFSIFIPTGRAINPLTGTNWEGRGVDPDVMADQTRIMNITLERARAAARTFQNSVDDLAAGELIVLSNLLQQIRSDSTAAIPEKLDSTLHHLVSKNLIDEWTINSLGYRYLNQNLSRIAISLFTFNTVCFPESGNSFDSLGEAYYRTENTEMAISCYQRALTIDPDNENARYMLQKLGGHP